MDNQTHSITTKRNVHGGTEEHTENLLNMSEGVVTLLLYIIALYCWFDSTHIQSD